MRILLVHNTSLQILILDKIPIDLANFLNPLTYMLADFIPHVNILSLSIESVGAEALIDRIHDLACVIVTVLIPMPFSLFFFQSLPFSFQCNSIISRKYIDSVK